MTRRIRVLQAIQDLDYGGMERVLADLVRELDPERFETHVLTLSEAGRFGEGLDAYAAMHQADPGRHSMLRPRRLARQIAAIAPDVVHTHSGVWFKVGRAARMVGAATVHTDHGRPLNEPALDRWLHRVAAGWTDCTVAVSADLEAYLRRRVVGPRTRLTTVENGIDTNEYRLDPALRAEARAALGLSEEATVITCVGRLEPVKRHDLMIEAFSRLRGQLPADAAVTLVLAGDGTWAEEVAGWVKEARLEDHVHLLGWTDDPLSVLNASDLFALTSDSEGTSISLLEAMSVGLCPVVTDVGGNAAVLGDGLSHWVVPRRDPRAISERWGELVLDPSLRDRVSRAARQRVCDRYSVQRMTREYAAIFEDVVGARGGSRR